jgi:triose/dihydroxyacetone kinase / FAD-AMP lyase (cyclizing)
MFPAKHFHNDPSHIVSSSLRSLTLTNPSLLFDETNKIIYRNPAGAISKRHIAVISGGGSGHEPGYSAFVGPGLLAACVCGSIFASPSADQIRKCLLHRIPAEAEGILVIVMNYTGDILNFGMGIEKGRSMGKKVAMLVVGDDVGVGRAKSGKVGRRGLSGTAFVVKVCGALAEMGSDLEECFMVGNLVVENLVSLGASLSRVHVPGRPYTEARAEEERLGPGLVEIGMGIHNEPGCEKIKADISSVIENMLAQLLDPRDKDRAFVSFDRLDQTVLLVNNFGGVSNLELGAIVTETITQLEKKYDLNPRRVYAGTFVGSLNGPGFSLSLLNLKDTGLGPGKSILELLDAPTEATGWPAQIKTETWEKEYTTAQIETADDEQSTKPSNLKSKSDENCKQTSGKLSESQLTLSC